MGANVETETTANRGEADRRRRERATVAIPFALRDERGRIRLRARTLDLSSDGALLHGHTDLPVGHKVQLEVVRGPTHNPLTLAAEVVRSTDPGDGRRLHGLAIRFVDLDPLDETLIADIIAQATG